MSIARFKVNGQFDRPITQEGTLEIDRKNGLISVRPKGRRRVYTLPLAVVAEYVCWKVIKAEVIEGRKEKALERQLKKM